MIARLEPYRPRRADWGQAGLVALALFALYAATSPRTVALEDDGLFVLASYYLGIAHPPGYPLFTLLGKAFTLLPFGSVAYRVHLVSALFGALSCAMLWLCVRLLLESRVPAYLAAFALGVSPVFWSQSIIAEVYTLNTFLFLTLVFLGLRVCGPGEPGNLRLLPWMALVFGLSLSNHWPLMLLAAPAFAVLLWPRRQEIARRVWLLGALVAIGLLPYAWMVVLSWAWRPISFDGPLQTLGEVWHFVSRAGYADVDNSASAGWIDRLKFLRFFGGQLLVQFAVVGTLLGALGAAAQRRAWGGRISAFLTVAFLMPSVVLLLLLGFDYDSVSKHVFHVYPLPAYAIGALWIGLGFEWLRQRHRVRPQLAATVCVAALGVILAVGSRFNVFADHQWGARYAQTILRSLPKDAVLFVKGDADLAPIAYFYLVEGWRPDIELYHSRGLVLGNRLFHPLRTGEDDVQRRLKEFIEAQTVPIAFTLEHFGGYARRDRWLYVEVDKSSSDPYQLTIDLSEQAVRFFEESIASVDEPNAWVAFHQNELRRRYATLLAGQLQRGQPLDEHRRRHLALLRNDFYGALGIAEGIMGSLKSYPAGAVADALERARQLMPVDASKAHRSRYLYLRGALRLDLGDKTGGLGDFETAFAVWPSPDNSAVRPLRDMYRAAGDQRSLEALDARVRRKKP